LAAWVAIYVDHVLHASNVAIRPEQDLDRRAAECGQGKQTQAEGSYWSFPG
jgi:hypothetical protein